MTTTHTCSYHCARPECVLRQRDELRERCERLAAALREVDNWDIQWAEGLDSNVERIKAIVRDALGEK